MAEYLAFARIFQLILISLIGFACVYLGYKLFSQIPISTTSDGQIKIPRFAEVKLKAAPGIFFAVVGAAIIYSSIDRTITITGGPALTDNTGSGQGIAVPPIVKPGDIACAPDGSSHRPQGFRYTCRDR